MRVNTGEISFNKSGPDIIAQKDNTIWRIECKGFGGEAAHSTDKNHFDRAVASAVSYYDQQENLRIGLALPVQYETRYRYIRNKIPLALRKAINLWILLYAKDEFVAVFSPEDHL